MMTHARPPSRDAYGALAPCAPPTTIALRRSTPAPPPTTRVMSPVDRAAPSLAITARSATPRAERAWSASPTPIARAPTIPSATRSASSASPAWPTTIAPPARPSARAAKGSAFNASPTATARLRRRPAPPISSARADVYPIRAAAVASPFATWRRASASSAEGARIATRPISPSATAATVRSVWTRRRALRPLHIARTGDVWLAATIRNARVRRRAARAALAALSGARRRRVATFSSRRSTRRTSRYDDGGGRRDRRAAPGWREPSPCFSLCLLQQSAQRHSTMNVPWGPARRESLHPNFGLMRV